MMEYDGPKLRSKIANTANCRSEAYICIERPLRGSHFGTATGGFWPGGATDALPEARHGIIFIGAIALVIGW